jgi:hypothetical protein
MNLPILGSLFRSRDYLHNETELLILVTPYIVHALDPREVVRPDANYSDATDPQSWLLGRVNRLYSTTAIRKRSKVILAKSALSMIDRHAAPAGASHSDIAHTDRLVAVQPGVAPDEVSAAEPDLLSAQVFRLEWQLMAARTESAKLAIRLNAIEYAGAGAPPYARSLLTIRAPTWPFARNCALRFMPAATPSGR